ncbi:MAG TPA: aldo/keto reductase [Bryobacteraceae bacterium]|nr:aldo/keto reductase [Bryobacteraceae bacterium]
MQYARLGDTGLVVSRLAFGAMTFGRAEGIFAAVSKVDQPLANELVAKALDAGINHFNTADVYTGGQSEQMLAKALGSRRKDVVVSTKVGARTGQALLHQGLSRQHILSSAEDSLRRLNTDYIDIYLVHRVDLTTPIEETLEALDTLARTGKVRYIGFSNWNAWRAAKAVGLQSENGWAKFRAAEMYYSLIGRDIDHEVVPFIEQAGIGILAWSPLAGGFLSGKYSRQNPKGDGGRLSGSDFLPFDKEKGYQVVEKIRATGQAHNASPAQVALAWMLTKPFVSSILLGANKMAQLEDNLAAVNVRLAPEEIADLEQLTAPDAMYPNWFTERVADPVVREALSGKAKTAAG